MPIHRDDPNEPFFAPADPSTRKDAVVRALREAIISSRLAPGTQLNEARLAEQLQVSRSPLREAIRQLAEEGMVETVSYKGARVAELNGAFVEELYSLRAALEEFALRRAMARDALSLDELETVVSDMDRAAGRKQRSELVELDLRFHRALCELAGHRLLTAEWDRLSNHTRRCINATSGYRRELSQIAHNHRQLIEVIRDGNVERATLVLREHIIAAGNGLRQWLGRAVGP
jgi:DNA-binding GntR family transcriptional regulator